MATLLAELVKFFNQLLKAGMNWKVLLIIFLYLLPIATLIIFYYCIKKHFDEKHDAITTSFSNIKPCTGECLQGILVSLEHLENNLKDLPQDTDFRDISENIKVLSGIVDTMKIILISWGGNKQ